MSTSIRSPGPYGGSPETNSRLRSSSSSGSVSPNSSVASVTAVPGCWTRYGTTDEQPPQSLGRLRPADARRPLRGRQAPPPADERPLGGARAARAPRRRDRTRGPTPPRLSPGCHGTRTSTQPSSRVRTISAPAIPFVAHHATSGANATTAVVPASPGPHGPAWTTSAARKPSGGSLPSPSISRSDASRERRNERISARSQIEADEVPVPAADRQAVGVHAPVRGLAREPSGSGSPTRRRPATASAATGQPGVRSRRRARPGRPRRATPRSRPPRPRAACGPRPRPRCRPRTARRRRAR